MNDGDDDATPGDQTDDIAGAAVDFDRLIGIEERLGADERFARITRNPEYAPDRLVCRYDPRFYPRSVDGARLEIAWYENGDFSIHYHETHAESAFDHRWDRHPSTHNERDHVHPGPDAPTPGVDVSHPADWRDVLSMVLSEIETRQRGFWSE